MAGKVDPLEQGGNAGQRDVAASDHRLCDRLLGFLRGLSGPTLLHDFDGHVQRFQYRTVHVLGWGLSVL